MEKLKNKDRFNITGKLRTTFEFIEKPEKAIIIGCELRENENGLLIAERENTFLNLGLQITLDRLFAINGPPGAVSHIAVSGDDQTPLVNTTLLDMAGGDSGFVSKPLNPAASRTDQTVTAGASFTQADISFPQNKIGLLNIATDSGTGLLDVIGGTDNNPFSIDLTGAGTWALRHEILVTASAT